MGLKSNRYFNVYWYHFFYKSVASDSDNRIIYTLSLSIVVQFPLNECIFFYFLFLSVVYIDSLSIHFVSLSYCLCLSVLGFLCIEIIIKVIDLILECV